MSYYPPQFSEPAGPAGQSAPLRRTVVALLWVTTLASAAVTVSTYLRRAAWQDSLDGGTALVDDLDGYDVPVIIAVFVLTMLVVTTAIAVALWTVRLVTSAQARGAEGLSPGWAAAGWFVPIGFLVLGFRQITRSLVAIGREPYRVLVWQISFVVVAVAMTVAQLTSEDISGVPTDGAISSLTREFVLSAISTVAFAVSATLATRAIRDADEAMAAVAPIRR